MIGPPTLVYVASPSNSGSTLLDLLVASHSAVASVGPLKVFAPAGGSDRRAQLRATPCMCGAPTKDDCAFWRDLDHEVRASVGCGVWELDLASRDPGAFREHNLAMLNAIATVTGCTHVVESSKSAARLARLLACPGVEVRPVRLHRDPRGVVHSRSRRGHPWLRSALRYTHRTLEYRQVLRGVAHYRMSYEHLAQAPADALGDLMPWLGLDLEPTQLDWTRHQHHLAAGNAMRFARRARIELDRAWESELSSFRKAVITLLTYPARD
ncbi:MAG: hypothetical protein H6983_15955 [Ectothiorhodospiraceae bacterium]|nr:hypothetical protein [Chromatiales bacterium]MCP5155663.1 hypothetical protein [Ectothiorhodospiraceae bacterium]